MRHLAQWIGDDRSEDHLAACCWNCFAHIQTEQWIEEGELPKELNHIGDAKKVRNSDTGWLRPRERSVLCATSGYATETPVENPVILNSDSKASSLELTQFSYCACSALTR